MDRDDTRRWRRTPVCRGFAEGPKGADQSARVDREAGTLRRFIAMETGVARGHGEEVDGETLDAIVRLAAGRSIKMRFGHPPMSDDAIGTSVGRASNFRREGDRVIADATLLKAAKTAPGGNLFEHVLDLAEEAPEMFGTSLVIMRDLAERLDEKGEPIRDDDGRKAPPFIRPTAVLASDFVDTPAATPALFSESGALLSAEASGILAQVLSRPDAEQRIGTYLERLDADNPGAAETLRAALALAPSGDAMAEELHEPAPAPAFDHKKAAAELRAAGFTVGDPPAPEEPAAPAAPDDGAAAELRREMDALKGTVAELREEAKAAKAKAIEMQMATYASQLDALDHIDAQLREQAKGHVETLVAAGDSDAAESFVAAYEAMPNIAEMASLDTEISVPIEDGKSRKLDLSHYQTLAAGENGPRVVLQGDREEMAEAALVSEIDDADERRKARIELFKRGKGGAA